MKLTYEAVQALAQVRADLAQQRFTLLIREQELKQTKAERETYIIASTYNGDPKNMGSNEEDRKRKLALHLGVDTVYVEAYRNWINAEKRVGVLQADLDTTLDLYRYDRLVTLDKLATAFAGIPTDTTSWPPLSADELVAAREATDILLARAHVGDEAVKEAVANSSTELEELPF